MIINVFIFCSPLGPLSLTITLHFDFIYPFLCLFDFPFVSVCLSVCLSVWCVYLFKSIGLSPQDLAQLMSVGETIGSLGTMAADVTKGLSSEFIEREMELLSAIMDGKAIEHHLEPSYYKALCNAVENHNRVSDSGDDEVVVVGAEDV